MTTLHQAIGGTWKILKWLGLILGTWFLIIILLRVYDIIRARNAPPPPPTVGYGKLPPVSFPQTHIDTHYTYTINTVTGLLPVFPDREPVYRLIQPMPSLNDFKIVSDLVNNTEFNGQLPVGLSDTLYSWSLPNPPFKKLTVDILYRDIALVSNYTTDPTVIDATNLSDVNSATGVAKDFFNNLSSFPKTIDETKTKTSLFYISGGQLKPALKIDNAQLIRIDFYYGDLAGAQKDEIVPIYYPNYPNSIINATIASGNTGQQIVEAHYSAKTWETKTETYPLKTAQEALKSLQDGNGYLLSYDGTNNSINIKNITLGYYLDDTRQFYIMPIIIFQGDNNFLAYVNAVKDAWIQK